MKRKQSCHKIAQSVLFRMFSAKSMMRIPLSDFVTNQEEVRKWKTEKKKA